MTWILPFQWHINRYSYILAADLFSACEIVISDARYSRRMIFTFTRPFMSYVSIYASFISLVNRKLRSQSKRLPWTIEPRRCWCQACDNFSPSYVSIYTQFVLWSIRAKKRKISLIQILKSDFSSCNWMEHQTKKSLTKENDKNLLWNFLFP